VFTPEAITGVRIENLVVTSDFMDAEEAAVYVSGIEEELTTKDRAGNPTPGIQILRFAMLSASAATPVLLLHAPAVMTASVGAVVLLAEGATQITRVQDRVPYRGATGCPGPAGPYARDLLSFKIKRTFVRYSSRPRSRVAWWAPDPMRFRTAGVEHQHQTGSPKCDRGDLHSGNMNLPFRYAEIPTPGCL
jgi:hypothetical protein